MFRFFSFIAYTIIGLNIAACSYWSNDHAFFPIPADPEELLQSEFLAMDHMDESPEVLMKKSELLIEKHRIAEALQIFDRVEREDVNPVDWLWLQCRISHAVGNVKTGIKTGEELLTLGSSFYDLNIKLADLYVLDNNPEEAFKQISRAISINPYDPEIYRKKGNIALEMNDTAMALDMFGKAIQLGLAEKSFLEAYITMLIQSGRSSMADGVLDDLRKTDPDNPLITLLAAQIKFDEDELTAADRLLSYNFVANNPDRSIFILKGKVKMSLIQYDSVVFYSNLLLTRGPDKEAYKLRGKALDKRYRYQEAVNSYYQALKLDTGDINTRQEIDILHRKIAYVNRIKQAKLDSANRQEIKPLQIKPIR